MRWKDKMKPVVGDKRTIKRFLIFPKLISNEWRWLEVAHIEQRYEGHYGGWVNMHWVNI